MKVVPLEGATMTLPELAKGEAVLVTRNGQPLLSIRDVSESDWESAALAQDPRFAALIEQSRRSHRDRGGIRIEHVRQELDLDGDPSASDSDD